VVVLVNIIFSCEEGNWVLLFLIFCIFGYNLIRNLHFLPHTSKLDYYLSQANFFRLFQYFLYYCLFNKGKVTILRKLALRIMITIHSIYF